MAALRWRLEPAALPLSLRVLRFLALLLSVAAAPLHARLLLGLFEAAAAAPALDVAAREIEVRCFTFCFFFLLLLLLLLVVVVVAIVVVRAIVLFVLLPGDIWPCVPSAKRRCFARLDGTCSTAAAAVCPEAVTSRVPLVAND